MPLGACSALSGKPDPLLMSPAVPPLPRAGFLSHTRTAKGTRSQGRSGGIPSPPTLRPAPRLEGARSPCGEPSSKPRTERCSASSQGLAGSIPGSGTRTPSSGRAPGVPLGPPGPTGPSRGSQPEASFPEAKFGPRATEASPAAARAADSALRPAAAASPRPLGTAAAPSGTPGHDPGCGSGRCRGSRGPGGCGHRAERSGGGRAGGAARSSPVPAASAGGAARGESGEPVPGATAAGKTRSASGARRADPAAAEGRGRALPAGPLRRLRSAP